MSKSQFALIVWLLTTIIGGAVWLNVMFVQWAWRMVHELGIWEWGVLVALAILAAVLVAANAALEIGIALLDELGVELKRQAREESTDR